KIWALGLKKGKVERTMSSKSSKHIAVEPVSSVSLPSKPFKSCFLAFDGFWFVSALGCSIIESGLFFQHEASRVLPPLQAQMRRAGCRPVRIVSLHGSKQAESAEDANAPLPDAAEVKETQGLRPRVSAAQYFQTGRFWWNGLKLMAQQTWFMPTIETRPKHGVRVIGNARTTGRA